MKTCAFPFFLYVVYQSFRLPAAYLPDDKLRVLGGKEPIPI